MGEHQEIYERNGSVPVGAAAATDELNLTKRTTNKLLPDDNKADDDGDAGVPHVISYQSMGGKGGSNGDSRRMRETSDLTSADGLAPGGVAVEKEPLLPKTNESTKPKVPVLKQAHFSSLTRERSDAAPPSPRARKASFLDGGRSSSMPRSFGSSASSVGNMLRRSTSNLLGGEDFAPENAGAVVAPTDSMLPPRTELLGSSRIMAREIRREASVRHSMRMSAVTMVDEEDGEGASESGSISTARTHLTLREIEERYLEKARTTFYNDAVTFAEGTIPQSIIVAMCVGVVCGVVAYCYYSVLDYFLELIWKDMPHRFVVGHWPENLYILWIPLVTFTLSLCCGLSINILGEPGDLAYTIQCVHEKGYKGTHHIIPMVAASQFTILAGASLGPEAPLVAICAATAGFLSRKVFKQSNRNVVRKHTLMGMAGALAAFFGVPLGGSMFALEVASRFGIEYFEHLMEAIFAGEICVVVFRTLAGLPLGSIWTITDSPLTETHPHEIVVGSALGLLGAALAFAWANFHWRLMDAFRQLGLLDDDNQRAVPRAMLGATAVVAIGVLVPHTMFWGEWEIGPIATLSPASELPHVWPTWGLIGFEMNSWQSCAVVGFAKLVAISFTVAGGFRGGYIFPFFAAGAAFGRAMCFIFPSLNPAVATLCLAAGINVAITRTALATTLILSSLSGEQHALPIVLAASVVSLFATGYVPFIKSQLARSDIDFSLFYQASRRPRVEDSMRPTDKGKDETNKD